MTLHWSGNWNVSFLFWFDLPWQTWVEGSRMSNDYDIPCWARAAPRALVNLEWATSLLVFTHLFSKAGYLFCTFCLCDAVYAVARLVLPPWGQGIWKILDEGDGHSKLCTQTDHKESNSLMAHSKVSLLVHHQKVRLNIAVRRQDGINVWACNWNMMVQLISIRNHHHHSYQKYTFSLWTILACRAHEFD